MDTSSNQNLYANTNGSRSQPLSTVIPSIGNCRFSPQDPGQMAIHHLRQIFQPPLSHHLVPPLVPSLGFDDGDLENMLLREPHRKSTPGLLPQPPMAGAVIQSPIVSTPFVLVPPPNPSGVVPGASSFPESYPALPKRYQRPYSYGTNYLLGEPGYRGMAADLAILSHITKDATTRTVDILGIIDILV